MQYRNWRNISRDETLPFFVTAVVIKFFFGSRNDHWILADKTLWIIG